MATAISSTDRFVAFFPATEAGFEAGLAQMCELSGSVFDCLSAYWTYESTTKRAAATFQEVLFIVDANWRDVGYGGPRRLNISPDGEIDYETSGKLWWGCTLERDKLGVPTRWMFYVQRPPRPVRGTRSSLELAAGEAGWFKLVRGVPQRIPAELPLRIYLPGLGEIFEVGFEEEAEFEAMFR